MFIWVKVNTDIIDSLVHSPMKHVFQECIKWSALLINMRSLNLNSMWQGSVSILSVPYSPKQKKIFSSDIKQPAYVEEHFPHQLITKISAWSIVQCRNHAGVADRGWGCCTNFVYWITKLITSTETSFGYSINFSIVKLLKYYLVIEYHVHI